MQTRSSIGLRRTLGAFAIIVATLVLVAGTFIIPGVAQTVHGMSMPRAGAPNAVLTASCNAQADLQGLIITSNHGTIANTSSTCMYDVGIASYTRTGGTGFDNQVYFSSSTATIGPKQTVDLEIGLPPCDVQVDLFVGPTIQSFTGSSQYGSRLLAYKVGGTPCATTYKSAALQAAPSSTAMIATKTAAPPTRTPCIYCPPVSPTRTAVRTATRTETPPTATAATATVAPPTRTPAPYPVITPTPTRATPTATVAASTPTVATPTETVATSTATVATTTGTVATSTATVATPTETVATSTVAVPTSTKTVCCTPPPPTVTLTPPKATSAVTSAPIMFPPVGGSTSTPTVSPTTSSTNASTTTSATTPPTSPTTPPSTSQPISTPLVPTQAPVVTPSGHVSPTPYISVPTPTSTPQSPLLDHTGASDQRQVAAILLLLVAMAALGLGMMLQRRGRER